MANNERSFALTLTRQQLEDLQDLLEIGRDDLQDWMDCGLKEEEAWEHRSELWSRTSALMSHVDEAWLSPAKPKTVDADLDASLNGPPAGAKGPTP